MNARYTNLTCKGGTYHQAKYLDRNYLQTIRNSWRYPAPPFKYWPEQVAKTDMLPENNKISIFQSELWANYEPEYKIGRAYPFY